MYLHLVSRDKKFLPVIHKLFEQAAPGQNVFAVYDPTDSSVPPWATRVSEGRGVAALLRTSRRWKGVTTNGLFFSEAAALLTHVPRELPVAWYVWGAEAYTYWPQLRQRLHLPETERLVGAAPGPPYDPVAREPFSRIAFCVTSIREDYELFRKCGLPAHVKYHWGLVGTLEDCIDTTRLPAKLGQDIQLGNSASPPNNHLDAISMLAKLDLGDRRVIVPLSYGSPTYRDAVISVGRERLGERFTPLVEFMPKQEYWSLLESCNVVIMNHCRQQAHGNIMGALWRGARVYMNDTTLFRGLSGMGCRLDLLSRNLNPDNPDVLSPQESEWILRHRDLLRENLGAKRVLAETKRLLKNLASLSGG